MVEYITDIFANFVTKQRNSIYKVSLKLNLFPRTLLNIQHIFEQLHTCLEASSTEFNRLILKQMCKGLYFGLYKAAKTK